MRKDPDTTKRPGSAGYIFKYYAKACIHRYFVDDVGRESAALAYYLLFSIFPLMIFFSFLLGLMDLDLNPIISSLYDFMPEEAAGVVGAYLRHVSQIHFGPATLAVLFCCLWFPMRATNSLTVSIRKGLPSSMHRQNIGKHQLRLLFYAIFLMVAIVFGVLFLLLSKSALTLLTDTFVLSIQFVSFWTRFRLLFIALLMFLVLYVFYLNGCERRHPKFTEVCPGIIGALVAWLILCWIFSHFVGSISVYSLVYGSISSIIVLMLWLYFSSTVLIMGAKFNQVLNETRKKYGRWKPLICDDSDSSDTEKQGGQPS